MRGIDWEGETGMERKIEGSAHRRSGGETDLVGKKVPRNSLNQNWIHRHTLRRPKIIQQNINSEENCFSGKKRWPVGIKFSSGLLAQPVCVSMYVSMNKLLKLCFTTDSNVLLLQASWVGLGLRSMPFPGSALWLCDHIILLFYESLLSKSKQIAI